MQGPRDSYYERVRSYTSDRVAPFNAANRRCPQARATERRLLIERLELRPGLVVLDTGTGGGYLIDAFPSFALRQGTVICSDTAEHFVRSIPSPFLGVVCGMDAFALADESIDRVSNLVGLHHVERKASFFAEAYRVLKPNGLVAVADVKRSTRPAKWLNGPVDHMTDIGHNGMFVAAGEFSALLQRAGFIEIQERHETYTWGPFREWAELIDYVRDLFRLSRASRENIENEVRDFLKVRRDKDSVALEWELTYASARKTAGGAYRRPR